jgi:hypothetical protein
VISLVTVSTARLRLAQRGLIAALRHGLERLVSELSSQGLLVVSNEADVIDLAREMGLGCLSISTGGDADTPWPTGAKAGLEWCGHDDKARRGIVLVDAALLIEDRQALERFLAFVGSQPSTPVIGMRQARDHPCQMFSAWRIVDMAIMKKQDDAEAASGKETAEWEWFGSPGQAPCRCRVPLSGQAIDAVYFEAFDAGGECLGRRLVEVSMTNDSKLLMSLDWLGPAAVSLCAFSLRRVFDGAYDLELHFGSVEGLWNLDADSGVILDEKKEQGIFSRQKFPAVFPGNIMAAYFPPEMMSGELPPPLHKFTLLPLNLADADG